MSRLHVGGKVQIISAIPGFHLQMGIVTEITEPFVSGAQAREEALRELRLYVVRPRRWAAFSLSWQGTSRP
jgi:hypothetical protein